MQLSAGEKLGPYEILVPIGKGGMGEVWKAHDPRLNRDVAIKVSAAQFSERFEREAKAIAALNHPNICTLYDVGPNYLVMEFIEGEAPKGPMSLDAALRIARQIADALDAAHEKGITHRDLKPGNVKIKPDGTVKVLDFGLAKVNAGPPASGENSPTLTIGMTQAGMILGTAAYMAPEQARGKENVDKRADIWSFGVVLYEMLTGKRLFQGEDVGETLASVIKEQPNLDDVPRQVRPLLKRCLEKDPKKRLRDIGDMELLLSWDNSGAEPIASTAPSQARLGWVAWAVAALFLLTTLGVSFVHFREAPPQEQTQRSVIALPENSTVHSFAISPDGRTLVIAAVVNGKWQLWLRPMDALQAQPMAFTEDATYPFWSPDSRFIGFFAQGKLKKVAASGGPSQSLCDALEGRGGSWNREDVIVFSPQPGNIAHNLQRVAAAGGVPTDITKTKAGYVFPVFLPDGRRFLYRLGAAIEKAGIYLGSLDDKESRRILADNSAVVFAPSQTERRAGHLLFVRENTLMAAPFDAASAQVSGDVFPVAESASVDINTGNYVPATAAGNGVLVYKTGRAGTNQIGWYDRSGKSLGPVGAPGEVGQPSISPDEKSVAFSRSRGAGSPGFDLWVRDLSRGTETRFTSNASFNVAPFWSPQGDRIVFASKGGVYNLYQKAASGSGQEELLLAEPNVNSIPTQGSRDGRFIVYVELDPKTNYDLWVLPTEGAASERKPIPFLRTEFNELFGQLSPDSHWMAFTSNRSGRREVYVRPFPPTDGEWTISIAGGEQPRWRGDGKELFFEAADGKMMAVPVKAIAGVKPSFEPGAPVALFDTRMVSGGPGDVVFEYDVTADGKRFLINTAGGAGATSPPLTVVANWNAGVKK
jgi:Tol biopolymer transport system component/predicted Ser/Thr protein kinase